MTEANSLRLTQTGFLLVYLAVMGALGLMSFKYYAAIGLYFLLPMGIIGGLILGIGRFAPWKPRPY
jgi:hypothetical protein